MTGLPSEFAVTALGESAAATLQQIIDREGAARCWGPHVTANDYLMRSWARLVDEIEQETYPDHMMVEEYANYVHSRELLETLVEVAPQEIADALSAWLVPLDARFMAATVRADQPVLGDPDPASPHAASPWHWRIPKRPTGRLGEDLARIGLL